MRIGLMIFLFSLSGLLFSQETKELSPKVKMSTSADLDFLLDKHSDKLEYTDEMDGYRIQVIYNTDRSEVYDKKALIYQQFTDFKSYIIYDQPYYKLRMGDFPTRLEARKYLEEVLEFFPTAFLVKDVIKIK